MNSLPNNRGFTLIEILVVMAISMILVGLVLAPVVQSFNMTRSAQAMTDAQDAAREAIELIGRELGEAMFVFDNSVVPLAIYGGTSLDFANGEQSPIQLPVRQPDGSIKYFTLPFGKIDFILPKMRMHCNNPDHDSATPAGPRDYDRGNDAWPPCPICKSTDVVARPTLPLRQDATVVRYFLGLRYNDPTKMSPAALAGGEGYFGWRSPWGAHVQAGEENQVVLYRVEFDARDDTLFPTGMTPTERLTDPLFFYRSETNAAGTGPCCKRWAEIARVIGIAKYQDLVVGTFDNNDNVTAVEPTVSFRFTGINNDTFAGTYSSDKSFDYPNPAPTTYTSAYGYWIDNHMDPAADYDDDSSYNHTVTILSNNNTVAYSTRIDSAAPSNLRVYKRVYDGSSGTWGTPTQTFDITDYVTNGNIPADAQMGFTIDQNRGKISFALVPPRTTGSNTGPICELDPHDINTRFHNDYDLDRGSARRWKTLGTFVSGGTGSVTNARIVPGTDRVVGPNMTPGANPAQLIQYERVPLALGDPGLNQYKIDYDTGQIYFSSVYNQDLPEVAGVKIGVDYKIQFNRDDDVIKGNYTTKSLVTVHLGMRMFDPESAKPHTVDLTDSVKVRNAQR